MTSPLLSTSMACRSSNSRPPDHDVICFARCPHGKIRFAHTTQAVDLQQKAIATITHDGMIIDGTQGMIHNLYTTNTTITSSRKELRRTSIQVGHVRNHEQHAAFP